MSVSVPYLYLCTIHIHNKYLYIAYKDQKRKNEDLDVGALRMQVRGPSKRNQG